MAAHYRQPGVFTTNTARTDVPQRPTAAAYGEGAALVDGAWQYSDGVTWGGMGAGSSFNIELNNDAAATTNRAAIQAALDAGGIITYSQAKLGDVAWIDDTLYIPSGTTLDIWPLTIKVKPRADNVQVSVLHNRLDTYTQPGGISFAIQAGTSRIQVNGWTNHGFSVDEPLLISGASTAALNGSHYVEQVIDPNSFVLSCTAGSVTEATPANIVFQNSRYIRLKSGILDYNNRGGNGTLYSGRTYSSATAYRRGDLVHYVKSPNTGFWPYQALRDVPAGINPTDTTYWRLAVEPYDGGGVEYALTTKVGYAGIVYNCILAYTSTATTPDADPTHWQAQGAANITAVAWSNPYHSHGISLLSVYRLSIDDDVKTVDSCKYNRFIGHCSFVDIRGSEISNNSDGNDICYSTRHCYISDLNGSSGNKAVSSTLGDDFIGLLPWNYILYTDPRYQVGDFVDLRIVNVQADTRKAVVAVVGGKPTMDSTLQGKFKDIYLENIRATSAVNDNFSAVRIMEDLGNYSTYIERLEVTGCDMPEHDIFMQIRAADKTIYIKEMLVHDCNVMFREKHSTGPYSNRDWPFIRTYKAGAADSGTGGIIETACFSNIIAKGPITPVKPAANYLFASTATNITVKHIIFDNVVIEDIAAGLYLGAGTGVPIVTINGFHGRANGVAGTGHMIRDYVGANITSSNWTSSADTGSNYYYEWTIEAGAAVADLWGEAPKNLTYGQGRFRTANATKNLFRCHQRQPSCMSFGTISSGTQLMDHQMGGIYQFTVGGSFTISNQVNPTNGAEVAFHMVAGGGGTAVITLGNGYKVSATTAAAINPVPASGTAVIEFAYNAQSGNWVEKNALVWK